jgi:hypothetical protein
MVESARVSSRRDCCGSRKTFVVMFSVSRKLASMSEALVQAAKPKRPRDRSDPGAFDAVLEGVQAIC